MLWECNCPKLQDYLNKVFSWADESKMDLNYNKSELVKYIEKPKLFLDKNLEKVLSWNKVRHLTFL